MARAQLGTTVLRQHRSSLIPTPSVSQIVRLAACSRENSLLPHHRAKFHSQTLMVSINWGSQAMPAGRQVLARWALALIMRRLVAGHITRLRRHTGRIRMLFTIARKTWSLPFACAATTEAPPMARQCRRTPRSAADCMAM